MTLKSIQPTTRLSDEFVQRYADREREGSHPLERSFNGLGYVVFKRTYARSVVGEDRSEEWYETVRRVCEGANKIVGDYTQVEVERLYDHIWNLRALPSGRALWQLGTPNNTRLGADSLVNCWFVNLTKIEDYVWMFNRLMLGGGVGFSVTGDRIGVVWGGTAQEVGRADADFIVPDSREGWSELLQRTLVALKSGESFTYSTQLVRPAGTPIQTFGGIASGPEPLKDGIRQIGEIGKGAKGRGLTSVERLDIANIIGSIVVSGNVRRSAQIAIGDPGDAAYLRAKTWDEGVPAYRAMSNNSVYVSDFSKLDAGFWSGYEGNGEAYGMVNLDQARYYGRTGERRSDQSVDGFNPCGEIALAHRESCNLAELVVPHFKSYDEMKDAAFLLYRLQKAIANMPYLDEESNDITHRNMRLGLSVTGVFQSSRQQLEWLDPLYRDLREEDERYSERSGLRKSIRLTTVQPSGTKSLLAGVTPGAHPGFSRFHVRRIRMASNDATFEYVKAKGYPWEFQRDFEGNEDPRTVVVEFPCEFPYNTPTADHVTWKDMLKMQEFLQAQWADNAVSITVYYERDDLPAIKEYLAKNWGQYKSLSFLLREDHGFDQAPLQSISIPEYEQRVSHLNGEVRIELGDTSEITILDSDCESGSCPIR